MTNVRSAHAQDNRQEDQERTDELGRTLPQQPTRLSVEEAEKQRLQGEESARTSQAIRDGHMQPGDDPRKFEAGVDKPHGGGTTESEANRGAGQPGPRPNPNNPDDPTNPASTAHRGETMLDGDQRRQEYGGAQSGQMQSGNAGADQGNPVTRNTGAEIAEKNAALNRDTSQDWPPQMSAQGMRDGEHRQGSTGQWFEAKSGKWVRVPVNQESHG